jgi:hypothetical protein
LHKNNRLTFWSDFEQFYAFITSSQELQAYPFHTYLDLAYFLESWNIHKKFQYVLLIGLECTPKQLVSWGKGNLDHDVECALEGAKWITIVANTRQRECPTIIST